MTKTQLISLLTAMADKIEENKIYLTSLDTEIGDGDHGINMSRGFQSVKSKVSEMENLSLSEILILVGKTLIKDVAGSAGPLYGSLFKCSGKVLGDKEEITLADFCAMLESGIEKIQALGGAKEGEKTMLDSMFPALLCLKEKKTLREAYLAAEQATEHTKDYIATKGRASYVGERSIGHQDPGATSFTLLLGVVENFTKETATL